MSETPQETPLANAPEARTPTGEIKDAQNPTTPTEPKGKAEASPAPTSPEAPKEEPKAEGEKSLLNKDEKPKAEARPGAPEKYEDFKAPDGFEVDKEALASALPVFKELGLSQPEAQKLVDFYATVSQKAAEAPFKTWQDTQAKWIDEVKADPEIGGKLDQVKAVVSRAIDGLGDPKLANDFRAAMDYTGAGNNPAFIRALYKLASKVTEGGNVLGNRPSPEGQKSPGAGLRSQAHALFPNLS